MKITAEFNSTEELISFIGAFGNKTTTVLDAGQNIAPVVETKRTVKNEIVKKVDKPVEKISVVGVKGEQVLEEVKETVPAKEAEIPEEEAPKEEAKVTKEMIRERLGAIMKSGKQKEAKDLLAKHGASKLPELKEEEYAAVFEEAEALL